MVSVGLALTDVGEVHLDDGYLDGPDTVGQGDGSVCVGSGVHHHSVINPVGLLQFVDQIALVV